MPAEVAATPAEFVCVYFAICAPLCGELSRIGAKTASFRGVVNKI